MTTDATESKALRLARYLKEFVGLRSTTVRDVAKYESALWFAEMPQETDSVSPAWDDGFGSGAPWLQVRKQQFEKHPGLPELIVPWVDQSAFQRATVEMPALRSTRLEPGLDALMFDEMEPPLVELHLRDYPEVNKAYDRFRPVWEGWSNEYRRRDRIQVLYAELFNLHSQVQKQGEIVELVLGLGLLEWRNPSNTSPAPIRRHVLTARVDLRFDSATGSISLEPSSDGAQVRIEDDMMEADLRPERGHYAALEQQLTDIGDSVWDRSRIFAALKSWAHVLHADSEWSADLQPAITHLSTPIVSFAPALLLRKRSQLGMVRVYDKIIDQLGTSPEILPPGWGSLIEDQDDLDAPDLILEADGSPSEPLVGTSEVFFPLAANREQRRIVEAMSQRRGVLVQGPPGTGKTHTIANLLCHLLATGKRVLVTAETGRALKEVRDKLPAQLQPLCVSLLGQGGDSFAELNSAVQAITTRLNKWSRVDYDQQIVEIEHKLDETRRQMAEVDTELQTVRQDETLSHNLMGGSYQGTASAIGERVSVERERFCWLRATPEALRGRPISRADMLSWLDIVRRYGADVIADAQLRIPATASLPTPELFAMFVASEREAGDAVKRLAKLHNHPAYQAVLALDGDERDSLHANLRDIDQTRRQVFLIGSDWLNGPISDTLNGREARWQQLHAESLRLINIVDECLQSVGTAAISFQIEKDEALIRADTVAVINYLQAGGKWTILGLFTPRELKNRTYLRDHVTIDGRPADTLISLSIIRNHAEMWVALKEFDLLWADIGSVASIPQPRIRVAAMKEKASSLENALKYAQSCAALAASLRRFSPPIPQPDWLNADAETWMRIIEASQAEEKSRLASERVTACLRTLTLMRDFHDAHPAVGLLVDAVEQRNVGAFSQSYEQVQQIEKTVQDQQFRQQTESTLASAVPRLVDSVAAATDDEIWDQRFSDWEHAWRWAIGDEWLRKRSDATYHQQLWQRRYKLDKKIGHLIAEAASRHAWNHFFVRLSPQQTNALKGWMVAVHAIGRGTGRSERIERLRGEARKYMDQCREAIPVWVMPRYLVAEMVDPAPNRYETVIVDEASQLGIESLFLFYISKKMVVVGDDQQISPYGIGIADTAVSNLQRHFLDGVPHCTALSAQSSLYANAQIRFSQNIVLQEHFRCMPEIIQFSNNLCYANRGTPLDPLRSYTADRLNPLVVRHVTSGYRNGGAGNAVNEPEADAILAQIVACIADPRYAGRTMGVISLLGEAQAKLIERMVLKVVAPAIIEQRKIMCGDAYAFQGAERHIVFLSMVAAPNERIGTLSDDSARQRFNVAASRAQDQLWLFHSCTLDVLSPKCMRYELLNYMLAPARLTSDETAQRFESRFEEDVWRLITDRGFHVRTQVCVGDPTNHRYRIDLVVEGMQGRLAVECDGDEWHGPAQYENDMARQRDLERAGWQFVRIRGGDFYRNRTEALEPIWVELDRLAIKPGGIDEHAGEPPPPAEVAIYEQTRLF